MTKWSPMMPFFTQHPAERQAAAAGRTLEDGLNKTGHKFKAFVICNMLKLARRKVVFWYLMLTAMRKYDTSYETSCVVKQRSVLLKAEPCLRSQQISNSPTLLMQHHSCVSVKSCRRRRGNTPGDPSYKYLQCVYLAAPQYSPPSACSVKKTTVACLQCIHSDIREH